MFIFQKRSHPYNHSYFVVSFSSVKAKPAFVLFFRWEINIRMNTASWSLVLVHHVIVEGIGLLQLILLVVHIVWRLY